MHVYVCMYVCMHACMYVHNIEDSFIEVYNQGLKFFIEVYAYMVGTWINPSMTSDIVYSLEVAELKCGNTCGTGQ